jgi:type II secretory pathway pseudopilin PulG
MKRILRAKTGMKNERGFSILEAVIACMIMIIGIGGLMALFVVAAAKNAGQGDQATRCTEYAQDKIEQLMALQYTPTYTDVTSSVVGSVTTPSSGCSPACGLSNGGTICPSPTTSSCSSGPTQYYVDYYNTTDTVDTDGISGSLQCATCTSNAQYMREWSITTNAATNVKTITVYVQALFTADTAQSLAPSTTLISNKGQY